MKKPKLGTFSVSFWTGTEFNGLDIVNSSTDFDEGYKLQLWEVEPNKYGNAFVGIYFKEDGTPTPDKLGLGDKIKFKRFIKEISTTGIHKENSCHRL
jgi:hypothetical protein